MTTLFEILKERLANRQKRNIDDGVHDYTGVDDWETRDRYVKSLRRQVRRIQDRKEKEQLQRIINQDERARDSSVFRAETGFKDNRFTIKKPQSKYIYSDKKNKRLKLI